MTAAEAVHELERLIREASTKDLAALLGELEAVKARAWSRLVAPAPSGNGETPADRNLSAEEAARRLGVSKEWLYRHAKMLPFAVKIGRRVLFSELGLERWNRHRRVLTA